MTDPNSRYVIVTGTLYEKQVILVSVHAPNWDDHNFVTSLFATIPNLDSHLLIMGGDMNWNRSSPRSTTPMKMDVKWMKMDALSTFMGQYGFVDPLASIVSFCKAILFFLPCTLFILAHRLFLDRQKAIVSTQYLPITVSDHATVMTFEPKGYRHWRLNPLLLADVNFVSMFLNRSLFSVKLTKIMKPSHPYCGTLSKLT